MDAGVPGDCANRPRTGATTTVLDGVRTARAAPASQLLDAVMAISSDLDLHSVLARIVESATALTGARYGALGVLGPDDTLGEFVTTGLTEQEHDRIGDLPLGRGILGLLISESRPLRLHDLTRHPSSSGFPPNHPPMTSFLGVPVHIRGTVFGNLYLTEKEGGGDFTDSDERLVVALANAAGLVIENARAYGLSERRRQWLEASAALTDALQPPVEWELALEQISSTARRVGSAWATAVVRPGSDGDVRTVACEPDDVATALGRSTRPSGPWATVRRRPRRRPGRGHVPRPWYRSAPASPAAARSSRCSVPTSCGCATSTSGSC